MPYPRPQRNTGGTQQNGTAANGKELTLLKIAIDPNDKLKVESAFGKVRVSEVKDTLTEAAIDFVNECWSKSDNEAVAIREFIGALEAVMIAVCGPELKKELLENLAKNIGYFERNLDRIR